MGRSVRAAPAVEPPVHEPWYAHSKQPLTCVVRVCSIAMVHGEPIVAMQSVTFLFRKRGERQYGVTLLLLPNAYA